MNGENDLNNYTVRTELANLINRLGIDSKLNTYDSVLAEYVIQCLLAFQKAKEAHELVTSASSISSAITFTLDGGDE